MVAMYDFLRKIPMFSDLEDTELSAMCRWVDEVRLEPGELLFAEGEPGERLYVIQEGDVEIIKSSGNREVLLAVRGEGEVIGEMSLLEDAPRMASVRARTPVTMLALSQEQFNELLRNSPSAARAMLHTMTARLRVTETMLRQSEKLSQLGTLSAGVAHELNNPSAAVQRGVGQLRDAVERQHQLFLYPSGVPFTEAQLHILRDLDAALKQHALKPVTLDPLACSDLEYELETWMGDHGIDNGWEYASLLVSMGFDADALARFAAHFQPDQLKSAVALITGMYAVYNLIDSVGRGAGHISDIVKSLKTYVFLDQAPVQEVDIHQGLKDTLSMLHSKMKAGIKIHREYAENLPRIQAYGSELNQVWTSVLDNAIYAVGESGDITIRTRRKGEWITVEIEDTGAGIPSEVLPRIFDPFFTTKPPGHGAGMGLTIAYNTVVEKQRGDLKIFSRPGKTTVRVTLPLNFETVTEGVPSADEARGVGDDTLRNILTTSKTVAVVGISSKDDRPSHTVPAYLQKQGYKIIPVNPSLDEVLGEVCYPDLHSVGTPVDVVLLFRPSETVPPIVSEAVEIGARVVWMQEGIINEDAAQTAREAGLEVVMDACMRVQHQRLIASELRRAEA